MPFSRTSLVRAGERFGGSNPGLVVFRQCFRICRGFVLGEPQGKMCTQEDIESGAYLLMVRTMSWRFGSHGVEPARRPAIGGLRLCRRNSVARSLPSTWLETRTPFVLPQAGNSRRRLAHGADFSAVEALKPVHRYRNVGASAEHRE